jgi:hypothetical protein
MSITYTQINIRRRLLAIPTKYTRFTTYVEWPMDLQPTAWA